jgi:type IV fimbrial biogenesis protein FimT
MKRAHTRAGGFSLIELMVTIVVASILLAVAVPNLRTFMRRSAVTSEVNDLIADLQQARSTAVTTRSLVAFCPRTTSTSTVACGTANTYENGWIIYIPTAAGAAYAGDGTVNDKTLIRTTTAVTDLSIRSLNGTVITFNQRGELSAGADINFAICSKARSGDTIGASNQGAQGSMVTQASSGRTASALIAVGDVCTPAS